MPPDHDPRLRAGFAHEQALLARLAPKLISRDYDASFAPIPSKTGDHRRHGDDREAGRHGCARQHHRGRAAGRRPLCAHRAQMVHVRADVRRLPRAGLRAARAVLFLPAAFSRGRPAQRHPHPAAERQAGQSLERLLGGEFLGAEAELSARRAGASPPSWRWSR